MTVAQVPTNIITGFLGVGKTTAIMHLLEHKPANEKWAVLVNEFGEIGIDGALLRESGAYVREVPGGCMCCVMGVPMQIGINRLLAESHPDRLLIEPTGLGHPEQVIKTLTKDFAGLLDLRATITLVDPRKLDVPRYVNNGNFQDQIAVADVLVANKADLCTPNQLGAFYRYAKTTLNESQPLVKTVTNGALEIEWLDRERRTSQRDYHHDHSEHAAKPSFQTLPTPDEQTGSIMRENSGQGFQSCGWVFHPTVTFNFDKLFHWLAGLACDRIKAVMITDKGIATFNVENGVLKIMELDDCLDSRIEMISAAPLDWGQLSKELDTLRE